MACRKRRQSVRPRLCNQADQEVGALVLQSVPLPPAAPVAGTGGGVPDRRRSAGVGSAARTRSCLRHSPAAGPPDVTHTGKEQDGELGSGAHRRHSTAKPLIRPSIYTFSSPSNISVCLCVLSDLEEFVDQHHVALPHRTMDVRAQTTARSLGQTTQLHTYRDTDHSPQG